MREIVETWEVYGSIALRVAIEEAEAIAGPDQVVLVMCDGEGSNRSRLSVTYRGHIGRAKLYRTRLSDGSLTFDLVLVVD